MTLKKTFFLILLFLTPSYISAFQMLSDFQEYAHAYPEFPHLNNIPNWDNPDYSEFHRNIIPSFFKRILHYIGLYKKPLFNPSWFIKQLTHITQTRHKENTLKQVIYLKSTPANRIFLWGDVHGAFHSLIRDLTFLKEQNIIDETFKIQNPDHYFIFNGDFIDRSPYTLETLCIMFLLLEKNPQQVFYLAGNHETNNYWINFDLKRELDLRVTKNENEETKIDHLISQFFDTLPLAFYISAQEPSNQVIRISHSGFENTNLNEQILGPLFEKQTEPLSKISIPTEENASLCSIDVHVLIKTKDWKHGYNITAGVELLDQDLGATTWTVFSSPTKIHQQFLQFHYDAFAEITLQPNLQKSTITAYHQNVYLLDGFKKYQTYNLYTGMIATEQTAIGQDILIGSTMSLVSTLASMGKRLKQGISVRINQENNTGGIDQTHPIRMFIYNDNITPSIARKNIINLLNEKQINLILLPVGNPMLAAYLDLVKENKIGVFFPIAGSSQFRNKDLTSIVHFRPSHVEEVKQLIQYALSEWASKKFAFFYQDDNLGKDPLKAAHELLLQNGITEWTDVPYTRSVANLDEQAQKIKNAQPDTICLFSTGNQTQELLRAMGMEAIANKKILAFSFLAEEAFREFLTQHGIKVLFACPVPNPFASEIEIVKEYRTAMDSSHHSYDIFSLEAYITTSILLHVLEMIPKPITQKAIFNQFESFKEYQFKGLKLTFNPETRDLSQPVWLETPLSSDWIEASAKNPYVIHQQKQKKTCVLH